MSSNLGQNNNTVKKMVVCKRNCNQSAQPAHGLPSTASPLHQIFSSWLKVFFSYSLLI